MEKGYFQIYTGTGKGKTTAALGLAMRAAGAGFRIYIGQFIKSLRYHEIGVLCDRFLEVTVELYGDEGCIAGREPDERDIKAARCGLETARKAVTGGEYDLVILDEIFIALYFGIIAEEEILALAKDKAPGTELVMTGRYATPGIIEAADLVTDMNDVRHYYSQGVLARDGIER